MKKIANLLTYVIMAVTAIVTVYFVISMEERVGSILVWSYILFGTAVVLMVVLPLFGIISKPSALKKTAINLAFMVVVFGISFLLASGAQTSITETLTTPPSSLTMKITDMGLKTTYFLFVISLLAIVFGTAISAIRNR